MDGDGDTDLVYGMGHNYGLYWVEQTQGDDGKAVWTKHSIDEKPSSVHTLLWTDLDGDGHKDELVTGKRVYAHEIEAGDTDASVIAWYRYNRDQKGWEKHVIFQGEPATNAPKEREKRDAQKDFPPAPPAPAWRSPPSISTRTATSTWSAPARVGCTCSRT